MTDRRVRRLDLSQLHAPRAVPGHPSPLPSPMPFTSACASARHSTATAADPTPPDTAPLP